MNIFKIENEYKLLMQEIEANEGELTDEMAQRLEITQANLQEKATNYAFVVKHYEGEADIIAAEIKRLQELKKKRENNIERLKDRVKTAMQTFGVSKIETPTLTLSLRSSKAVEVVDENLVDEEYFRVKKEVSKTELKKAIEEGKEVFGARIVENISLQIK
jgi:hypothetical protein